jgi:hypothetical protein
MLYMEYSVKSMMTDRTAFRGAPAMAAGVAVGRVRSGNIAGAPIAFLLGRGYYDSFRSGALTVKGRTSRRDHEPISYWFGMIVGSFAFLVLASGTVFMAFVVCAELFGRLNPK